MVRPRGGSVRKASKFEQDDTKTDDDAKDSVIDHPEPVKKSIAKRKRVASKSSNADIESVEIEPNERSQRNGHDDQQSASCHVHDEDQQTQAELQHTHTNTKKSSNSSVTKNVEHAKQDTNAAASKQPNVNTSGVKHEELGRNPERNTSTNPSSIVPNSKSKAKQRRKKKKRRGGKKKTGDIKFQQSNSSGEGENQTDDESSDVDDEKQEDEDEDEEEDEEANAGPFDEFTKDLVPEELQEVLERFRKRVDTEIEEISNQDAKQDISDEHGRSPKRKRDELHDEDSEESSEKPSEEDSPSDSEDTNLNESGKPSDFTLGDADTKESKRLEKKNRQLFGKKAKTTIAHLKQLVDHPELVEPWDCSSTDPLLLIQLKSIVNSVPIPEHWRFKRKYLFSKRGMEKRPYHLPKFLLDTGIAELRGAEADIQDAKSLKQQAREKTRPKMRGSIVEPEILKNAFFKFQTKPLMFPLGELYYELRELDVQTEATREFRPGVLSEPLMEALGITDESQPPPWLYAMQRYGPPPSYPNLKIPGANAPVPPGVPLGFQPGGWGQPPMHLFHPHFASSMQPGMYPWPDDSVGKLKQLLHISDEQKNKQWGRVEKPGMSGNEVVESSHEELGGESVHGALTKERDVLVYQGNQIVEPDAELDAAKTGIIELRKSGLDATAATAVPSKHVVPASRSLYRVLPSTEISVDEQDLMGGSHVYDMSVREGDMDEKGGLKSEVVRDRFEQSKRS